jgi:hypothetical protein
VLSSGFTLVSGSLTVQCTSASLLQWQPPVVAESSFGSPIIVPLSPLRVQWQLGSVPLPSFAVQAASAAPPLSQPPTYWLRFRWSYQSDTNSSNSGGTGAPVILSSAVGPSLSVDPTLLRAGVSYVFTLRVTDADPSHVHPLTGAAPTSQMNFSLTVTEPPRMQVQATQNSDPCAGSTLCLNGGTCQYEELDGDGSSAAAGGSVSYSLWCRCPSSPHSFFGPVCSFAVLSCPSCVSPFIGGATVRLYGIGLDSLFRISIAQRQTEFTPATFVNASTTDSEQKEMWHKFGQTYPNLQVLTLFTPALVQQNSSAAANEQSTSRRMPELFSHLSADAAPGTDLSSPRRALLAASTDSAAMTNPPSSYQLLTLDSALLSSSGGLSSSLTSSFVQVNYTRLLLYTSSSCGVGVWKEDGLGGCLSCPTGGLCPGGGRVWPLLGYWSYSEWTTPVRCAVEEACPGVDGEVAATTAQTNANGNDADPFTDTQRCAAAYTGARCADCNEGFYQLQSRCYFCGSSVDQSASIALTIIVALAVMALLATAAATLSAKKLARAVQLFTNLQAVAIVGVSGAKHSPFFDEELTAVFTYLNFSQSTQTITQAQ